MEGSGLYGASKIQILDFDGKILRPIRSTTLGDEYFGEGVTPNPV